jgi:ferredoxin
MSVTVRIVDGNMQELTKFVADQYKSFTQMAEHAGYEMPVSCCSGACMVCACRIIEGSEYVDPTTVSVPLIDVDDDQVLSCVGGVDTQAIQDDEDHVITLQ